MDQFSPRDGGEEKGVENLLFAAKQAVYRGRGEVPQLRWHLTAYGLVLVVDLWSGIATTVLALLALGVRCVVLAAEEDPEARQITETNFPNVVHVERVEEVTAVSLRPVLARRAFSCILHPPKRAFAYFSSHPLGDRRL